MTDLHCHVLHDIDDGPADLNASINLCRIAWNNQIERIVATPHITEFNKVDDFLRKREERLEDLRKALVKCDMRLELYPGAEVLVNAEAFHTDCLSHLTINQSRYLLVEFSYSGLNVKRLSSFMEGFQNCGLIPIIAHPERYQLFQHDCETLNSLLEKGAVLQVNASSLCMSGNRAENKLARELVRQRAVAFLATDAHSVQSRSSNLLDMLSCISLDIGFDYLDEMVNLNPNTVLQDKVIDTSPGRQIKKSRIG